MVLEFNYELILQLIQQHGTLAVVLGMIIEEVIVPIPSAFIPMAAGFLLVESQSLLPAMVEIFFLIALPASIASVISSYFVFSISYFGGKPVVKNYGKYLDIYWRDIEHLEHHFDSGHEKYYVALFRMIPIVPLSLISGAAGLFRMDWKTYGVWSFIGMLPRNFFFALLGWSVKDSFLVVAKRIESLSTAVALLAVLAVGGFIAYRKTVDLYRYLLKWEERRISE